MLARAGLIRVLLIGSLLIGVTACGTSGADDADGRIKVVTSTDVWGSVATAVGGQYVDVTAIIHDPGQDPHDYQSAPIDAATIGAAQLTVYNGDGYDDFFPADLQATPSPHRATIVAFDLSGRPEDSNEHIFYDLPTVRKVADAVAVRLGRLQPAHAAAFTHNASTFDAGIDSLLAKVRKIGTQHPGRRVVVTEPVADYLLQAAGITDATPPAFERAVESDIDTPIAALSATLNLIGGRQVAALVNNAQTETAVTGQLTSTARSAHVPVVDVTETLPAGATGYLSWMRSQVAALAAAVAR
jgi:zinc/manganese transport system substrate-binding protein